MSERNSASLEIAQRLIAAGQQLQSGKFAAAESLYRQVLDVEPSNLEASINLATVLLQAGRTEDAVAAYRAALRLDSASVQANYNLGIALMALGRLDEAAESLEAAIALDPNHALARSSFATILLARGSFEAAIEHAARAAQLAPNRPAIQNSLGVALQATGRLDAAADAYRAALRLRPAYIAAKNNLGLLLLETGDADAAIAQCREVLRTSPADATAWDNLLFAMHFSPRVTPREIRVEHERWDAQFTERLRGHVEPHVNDRDPDRRLRVGYVSSDFRQHPVGRFLLPLFEHHDKDAVEIFCYSNSGTADAMTARLRSSASRWRDILGRSDEEVAKQIREDRIDVLVDLAQHTSGNRLRVFARRPAPVQIAYLGYPGTTGLRTIDYRLSDARIDPPARDDEERWFTEPPLRLGRTYWCYADPGPAAPAIRPPPVSERGFVTFGALNALAKSSDRALALWARVLSAVPGSRLVMYASEGTHRARMIEAFRSAGIGDDRVRFVAKLPFEAFLASLHEIDVALDALPFAGGTTSCDALWMGAPLVTLLGATGVGRSGASILTAAGFGELVAHSEDEYVSIAQRLSGDVESLRELRKTMRQRMRSSALMDAAGFARDVEAAYRDAWHRWCDSAGST